jgi:Protein of unknown function (DUF3500)
VLGRRIAVRASRTAHVSLSRTAGSATSAQIYKTAMPDSAPSPARPTPDLPPVVAPVAGQQHGLALTPDYVGATLITFGAMMLYDALSREQQDRLVQPFGSPQRRHWNFLPEPGRGRHGVPLGELTHAQVMLVHRLIASAHSPEAYARVLSAFALEHVLREIDQPRLGHVAYEFRDPGNYYLTFFDVPRPDATWGWRLVGHHVSLNVTVLGQDRFTVTPMLIGAEPGRFGPLRPMAEEEDLAFELLDSLDADERAQAVIHTLSPPDFATRCVPEIGDVELPALHGDARRDAIITDADREALRFELHRPRGLPAGEMSASSRALFDALLHVHVSRIAPVAYAAEMERIAAAGVDAIHFAWAGELTAAGGHYYRLHGPVTLVEFNNTEGGANHVHSVWRSPERDFGGPDASAS